MLEGTDLFSAYQTYNQYENDNVIENEPKKNDNKILPQPQDIKPIINNDINKIQEQRLIMALNDYKKRKDETKYSESYLDKLFNKKKEIIKILQFSLIIVLGLSIHYFIDYYLKDYINNNDYSFERQLFIRLLYPLAIIFVLWNIKVFLK